MGVGRPCFVQRSERERFGLENLSRGASRDDEAAGLGERDVAGGALGGGRGIRLRRWADTKDRTAAMPCEESKG